MGILLEQIEEVLKNRSLTDVEDRIAEKAGCFIYRDDLPTFIGLIKKEVEFSDLPISVVSEFINNNQDAIVQFGGLLLEDKSPQMLSIGISISYAIYMIYLKEKNDKLLGAYIIKRRIPDPAKFLAELINIGEKVGL